MAYNVHYNRSFNRLQYSRHILGMPTVTSEPNLLRALEFSRAFRRWTDASPQQLRDISCS